MVSPRLEKVTAVPVLRANETRRYDYLKFWAILLHNKCNYPNSHDVTNNTDLQQSLASNVGCVTENTVERTKPDVITLSTKEHILNDATRR